MTFGVPGRELVGCVDDENYFGPWSKLLEDNGYPADEARAAALEALPDVLRNDRTTHATYSTAASSPSTFTACGSLG
jgi:hypothetical protein